MSVVRAVGFDLDGTLFDHRGSARAGVEEFFVRLGIEPSPAARSRWFLAEEEQFERWRAGEIGFQEQRRERLRTVLPPLGVVIPSSPSGLDELFGAYLRAYRAAWRVFPDSFDLLTSLRLSGYRVGILTNGSQEQQLDKLRTTGLLHALDVVCTSERLGTQKPERQAFIALADELRTNPASCLFVGDSPEHDVAGAQRVGMRTLLIDRYGTHAEGIASAVHAELASAL